MKKISKINLLILLILIFSNICFATSIENINENQANVETMQKELKNIQEDVMLINEENTDTALEMNEENSSEVLAINEDNITINKDLFLAGEDILVKENINGSAYISGNNIEITSEFIDGNVFIAANKVKLSGNIDGAVYIIANSIDFSGNANDLFVITNQLNIMEGSFCRGIKSISDIVLVNGMIERDLYTISNNIDIRDSEISQIGGTLYCTGKITGDTSKIGNIESLDIEIKPKQDVLDKIEKTFKTIYFVSTETIALIIIALIVGFSSKKSIEKSNLKQRMLYDTLYGFVYIMAISVILFILTVSIIGIPVVLVVIPLVVLVFWKINIPVASIEIAKFIVNNKENKSKILVIFIAFAIFTLIQLISYIPTIGGLVKFIMSLYGFGYMGNCLFKKNKQEEEQVTIIEN